MLSKLNLSFIEISVTVEMNLNTETILAYCKEFGVDPNYILCWKTIPDRKDGLTEERFMNILESYGKKLWNEISN